MLFECHHFSHSSFLFPGLGSNPGFSTTKTELQILNFCAHNNLFAIWLCCLCHNKVESISPLPSIWAGLTTNQQMSGEVTIWTPEAFKTTWKCLIGTRGGKHMKSSLLRPPGPTSVNSHYQLPGRGTTLRSPNSIKPEDDYGSMSDSHKSSEEPLSPKNCHKWLVF